MNPLAELERAVQTGLNRGDHWGDVAGDVLGPRGLLVRLLPGDNLRNALRAAPEFDHVLRALRVAQQAAPEGFGDRGRRVFTVRLPAGLYEAAAMEARDRQLSGNFLYCRRLLLPDGAQLPERGGLRVLHSEEP